MKNARILQSELQPQLNIDILLMMPFDLIQSTADCFTFGVPAKGVFEPEIDMAAQFEAYGEVGS